MSASSDSIVRVSTTISWRQVLALIVSSWLVTGALVGIIYQGVKDDIGSVTSDIRALRNDFQTATVAGISVREVIKKGSDLEQQFRETHDTVLRNGGRLDALAEQQKEAGGKLEGLIVRTDAIKSDTDKLLGALSAAGFRSPKPK